MVIERPPVSYRVGKAGPTPDEGRDERSAYRDRKAGDRDAQGAARDDDARDRDVLAQQTDRDARQREEAVRVRLVAREHAEGARAIRDRVAVQHQDADAAYQQAQIDSEAARSEAALMGEELGDLLGDAEEQRTREAADRRASGHDRFASEMDRRAAKADRWAAEGGRRADAADRDQLEIDAQAADPSSYRGE